MPDRAEQGGADAAADAHECPCWTIVDEFTHTMKSGYEYPILVGDHLEQDEDGTFVKVAPGIAVGGIRPPEGSIVKSPHRRYVIV